MDFPVHFVDSMQTSMDTHEHSMNILRARMCPKPDLLMLAESFTYSMKCSCLSVECPCLSMDHGVSMTVHRKSMTIHGVFASINRVPMNYLFPEHHLTVTSRPRHGLNVTP